MPQLSYHCQGPSQPLSACRACPDVSAPTRKRGSATTPAGTAAAADCVRSLSGSCDVLPTCSSKFSAYVPQGGMPLGIGTDDNWALVLWQSATAF